MKSCAAALCLALASAGPAVAAQPCPIPAVLMDAYADLVVARHHLAPAQHYQGNVAARLIRAFNESGKPTSYRADYLTAFRDGQYVFLAAAKDGCMSAPPLAFDAAAFGKAVDEAEANML